MIYDYVQTKPPMEDVIEHGWAKDAAAKVHKYLERWKGSDGKWRYRYKSKAQGAGAKVKRFFKGAWNASDEISKDGTLVRRPGLFKSKRSAYERRTGTRLTGKSKGSYISGYDKKGNPIYKTGKKLQKGKYISSASGGVTKKEIKPTSTTYVKNYKKMTDHYKKEADLHKKHLTKEWHEHRIKLRRNANKRSGSK